PCAEARLAKAGFGSVFKRRQLTGVPASSSSDWGSEECRRAGTQSAIPATSIAASSISLSYPVICCRETRFTLGRITELTKEVWTSGVPDHKFAEGRRVGAPDRLGPKNHP